MPADAIAVLLPDDVKQKVEQIARLTQRSPALVLNEAVAAYVQDREAYLEELDAAVKSAESGVGHSSQQIFKWMKSWGTDAELPAPDPDMTPQK